MQRRPAGQQVLLLLSIQHPLHVETPWLGPLPSRLHTLYIFIPFKARCSSNCSDDDGESQLLCTGCSHDLRCQSPRSSAPAHLSTITPI
jgi:hypothetical protein